MLFYFLNLYWIPQNFGILNLWEKSHTHIKCSKVKDICLFIFIHLSRSLLLCLFCIDRYKFIISHQVPDHTHDFSTKVKSDQKADQNQSERTGKELVIHHIFVCCDYCYYCYNLF